MKITTYIFGALLCLVTTINTYAQDMTTAIGYMQAITDQQQYLMQKSWNYMHTAAHSFDIDKITKAQKELIRGVEKSLDKIKSMPDFGGDTNYRDATTDYFESTLMVFKKEYKEMIDLKEVTLTSYNALENYLELQDLANQKMDSYFDDFNSAHETFANQHGITLIDYHTELAQKIKKSVAVIGYRDQLHLDFFESYIAEINLIASLKHEDASLIQQNNKKLKNAIASGKKKLSNRKSYENDDQLIKTVQGIFDSYQKEAEEHIPVLVNYYEAKEKFAVSEKQMKETPKNKLTQKMVDQYNKAVKEINKASKNYNKTQKKLNDLRGSIVLAWNVISMQFLDTHIPEEDI